MTRETAAARSAALLRQLDQSRQRNDGSRVSCVEPGCRSELLCGTRHTDNLAATWRCLEHRQDSSTIQRKTVTS
jgi:hypothetical protein